MARKIIKLNTLKLNPKNPRIIKDEQFHKLCNSIKEFPKMMELRPIIIDNNNMILGGNMRYKALQELKYKEIPANWIKKASELTAKEKREFIIKDNIPSGEWDFDLLANEFEIGELIDLGFDEKELDINLWNDKTDEQLDEVPDVPKEAISRTGDIFLIDGKHRVMCGDSTLKPDVEALMAGKMADVCFQSPPYNVGGNIGYKTKSKYINNSDNRKDYAEWLIKSCYISLEFSNEVFINIQFLANNKKDLITWLYELRNIFKDIFYWKKLQVAPQFSSNVANSQVENIILFGKNNNRKWGNKQFKGTFSNYIETKSASGENKEAKIHNATFPVKLPLTFLNHGYINNSVIADYFLGCGTTLIASQINNNICYGMEIDPLYIDVILKRYKNLYPDAKYECLNRKFNFNKLFEN